MGPTSVNNKEKTGPYIYAYLSHCVHATIFRFSEIQTAVFVGYNKLILIKE
jgi:hypothetical protein